MDGSARTSRGGATLTARARVRRVAFVALAAVGTIGLAACNEDTGPPLVSDEDYRESVQAECDRHMPALQEAWDELRAAPFSDAELAAFYRSEMVPRVRSIMRSVRNAGVPSDQGVQDAFGTGASALQEIEDDAAALIDRRRDGTFLEGENPWITVNEALEAARITCAVEPSNWEP